MHNDNSLLQRASIKFIFLNCLKVEHKLFIAESERKKERKKICTTKFIHFYFNILVLDSIQMNLSFYGTIIIIVWDGSFLRWEMDNF